MNKAYPKDEFPLPNIDLLIDLVASMFSFMDGYSGYNQIRMAAKDAKKTAFRTPNWKFLLHYDAFWPKKCRDHLLANHDSHLPQHDTQGEGRLCG